MSIGYKIIIMQPQRRRGSIVAAIPNNTTMPPTINRETAKPRSHRLRET